MLATRQQIRPQFTQITHVPIDHILKAEFTALGISPKQQDELRTKYENQVVRVIGIITASFPNTHIRDIPEQQLFATAIFAFRRVFAAGEYKSKRLLCTMLKDNDFNCYSSAVIICDALVRLGRQIRVVHVPNHVLLAGRKFFLETTESVRSAVKPPEYVETYPQRTIGGPGLLLASTYVWAGVLFNDARNFTAAVACSEEALKIMPDDPDAWTNYGLALERLGRINAALKAFDEALHLDPNFIPAVVDKGHVLDGLYRHNLHREAIACFQAAVKMEARTHKDWTMKSSAFSKLDRHHEALECCERALELQPENTEALVRKADCLRALGRLSEALPICEKVLGINPDLPSAWFLKSLALSTDRKFREAEQCRAKANALWGL